MYKFYNSVTEVWLQMYDFHKSEFLGFFQKFEAERSGDKFERNVGKSDMVSDLIYMEEKVSLIPLNGTKSHVF